MRVLSHSTPDQKARGEEIKQLFERCERLGAQDRMEVLVQQEPEIRTEVERLLEAANRSGYYPKAISSTDESALIPQQLGRYKLIRKLGTGGMASVYQAALHGPAGFEKMFAVKVVLPHHANNQNIRRLFEHEAKATGRLSHRCIVQTIEFQSLNGLEYMVMEFVDGCNLAEAAQEGGDYAPIPEQVVLHIASEIGQALDYAQRTLGIVHRDITPRNILLSKDGEVKLADFGISKTDDRPSLTETGAVRGTLRYIAPEIFSGFEADHRSDLFSLARCIRDLVPESSSKIELLIQKGLSPDASKRFPSAADFLSEIEPFLNAEKRRFATQWLAERVAACQRKRDSEETPASFLPVFEGVSLDRPSIDLEEEAKPIRIQQHFLKPRFMSFLGRGVKRGVFGLALVAAAAPLLLTTQDRVGLSVDHRGRAKVILHSNSNTPMCRALLDSGHKGGVLTINEGLYAGMLPMVVALPCEQPVLLSIDYPGRATAHALQWPTSRTKFMEFSPKPLAHAMELSESVLLPLFVSRNPPHRPLVNLCHFRTVVRKNRDRETILPNSAPV